jgi:hypothetical protein
MGTSGNVSPLRPLLIGGLVGFVIGLIIGLVWAWYVDPAYYAGGAYPNELSEFHQQSYVKSVSEAYFATNDVAVAANRLNQFTPQEKVTLLALTAKDFSEKGQATEASLVGDLAATLMQQEGWSTEDVGAGLSAAGATEDFSVKLGQVPMPVGAETPVEAPPEATPAAEEGAGSNLFRILAIIFIIILAVVAVLYLLVRIKPKRKPRVQRIPPEMMVEEDSGLQPLRQWVGTYTLGQDTYDESFTVETPESDFLGECGMGIMDGFASGSPKKVLAFDVWLFDKTDIRTISTPVMSKFAFEDEILRSKLPPDTTPILAAEGTTFDIETTALMVKAKIEEVAYGEGPPEMSYFTTLKISLSAYLKLGVDVSGTMPIPEQYA